MSRRTKPNPVNYEIKVRGKLDQSWDSYFDDLEVTAHQTDEKGFSTTLTGPVLDQSALRGILCKLWDLNLTLISVRRLDADDQ